jgi:hypothetical protein
MKKIVLEGFYDLNSGYEFDMPCFLVKPVIRLFDIGSAGEIDRIVEDYMIDLSEGEIWKDDKCLSDISVEKDFTKAVKGSKRFKHWKVIIDFDDTKDYDEEEFDYNIVKQKGF